MRFLLVFVLTAITTTIHADDVAKKKEAKSGHTARVKAGTALFKSSVRTILVKRCLSCHGGDTMEGEFNLATRAGLLKGGENGVAVVPGKSSESLMYRLITHEAKPHMPYDEPKLPKEQIAAIAKWIDLEAPYDKPLIEGRVELKDWTQRTIASDDRDFWSFRPLGSFTPPNINNETWCKSDIDRFVLRGLEGQNLRPNELADRRILIRRAFFDVTGLPPQTDELDRLLADRSPLWYDRMVDDLLNSKHFGERWARHWLDIARFAESHGFEQDYDREFAYHYRDFVIQAFNSDMPFDQFIQWQLAGDELAPDEPLALMATGFLGAGVFPTQLTENEFEPARYDELDDMVSTMGTAMLGMTIGCARCHDHKFDPIPSADYYRLASTFSTTIRSNIDVNLNPAEHQAALAKWEVEHTPLVGRLREYENNELGKRFDTWLASGQETTLKKLSNPWTVLRVTSATSKKGATLTVQSDDSILATGKNPNFDTYEFTAETQLHDIRSIRLEALSHKSMVRGGPGRASNGNMGLGTISIRAEPLADDSKVKPVDVKLTNPRATFEQNSANLSIASSIDTTKKTGWAVDPQFGKDHAAAFQFDKPIGFEGGTRLKVTLHFDVNNQHNIGRARLSISNSSEPVALDAANTPQALTELKQLIASGKPPSEEQRKQLIAAYRTIDPEWKTLSTAITEHVQKKPQPKMTKVMVSSEGVTPIKHHADGRGFPHFYKQTFYLKRGDTTQKLRPAEPGFLQVLTSAGAKPSRWTATPPEGHGTSWRRRTLANWMTDTESGAGHLLARVVVNRLWQHHIGRGIVATPNDFGSQGEPPSHPELLDWLATKLLENGWRLKPIHKLIMNSATYRQSSRHDSQREAIDPENRFLWRREPRRLEAEAIRDSMLAISDQLDRNQFGPGTLDEGHKRRSIYFKIKRSKLIPMMQMFDSPEPLASVGDRPTTTIASQALMFMNSPHVSGYAAGFAKRVRAPQPHQTIDRIYRMALSRMPTEAEQSAGQEFLLAQSKSYVADGQSAEEAHRLAMTDFCQTIFGLSEFIFVE